MAQYTVEINGVKVHAENIVTSEVTMKNWDLLERRPEDEYFRLKMVRTLAVFYGKYLRLMHSLRDGCYKRRFGIKVFNREKWNLLMSTYVSKLAYFRDELSDDEFRVLSECRDSVAITNVMDIVHPFYPDERIMSLTDEEFEFDLRVRMKRFMSWLEAWNEPEYHMPTLSVHTSDDVIEEINHDIEVLNTKKKIIDGTVDRWVKFGHERMLEGHPYPDWEMRP